MWRYFIAHPGDLVPLLDAAWALRRRAWWRRAPFVPVPDQLYWDFRLGTVGGSPPGELTPLGVVQAARWSRAQRTSR